MRNRLLGLADRLEGFAIEPVHFVQNDRVPGVITLCGRNVVFQSPAAELQFLDKINIECAGAVHGTNNLFP